MFLNQDNILVDERNGMYIALLSDFGSGKVLEDLHSVAPSNDKIINSTLKATVDWIAPDLVSYDVERKIFEVNFSGDTLTPSCDMWSFGCTCIEVSSSETISSSRLRPKLS